MGQFEKKPMYAYLMVLVICTSAGFQGWMALFTNFAKEVVGVNGFQIGVAQAVREIPGFLTFLVILVPFLIVNGILTGTFIEGEVVWYNPEENLGIRIFTIPVEDFGYGFSLILFDLLLSERWKRKQKGANTPSR